MSDQVGVVVASEIESFRRKLEAEVRAFGRQISSEVLGQDLAPKLREISNALPQILNSPSFISALKGADVGSQRSFVATITEFLGVVSDYVDANLVFEDHYPYHFGHDLIEKLVPVTECLVAIAQSDVVAELLEDSTLTAQLERIHASTQAVLDRFEEDPSAYQVSYLQWKIKMLEARFDTVVIKNADAAEKFREETASAVTLAATLEKTHSWYSKLTQGKAEGHLTKKFGWFRTKHSIAYFSFMVLAVVLMASSLAFAAFVSWGSFQNGSFGLEAPDLIWRITIITGTLGIATYFARQAGQHRTLSTWADSICVQLLTFDAYVESSVNPEQKQELRTEFAKRVFGPQPQLKGEPDQPAGSMDLLPLISAIAKATKADGTKGP